MPLETRAYLNQTFRFETKLETFFPQDNPSLKNLDKSKELFRTDDDEVSRFINIIAVSKSDNLFTL